MSAEPLSAPLMASASANDPFYTMRDVCEGEISSVKIDFDRWQIQLKSVDTATDVGFQTAHQELGKRLEKIVSLTTKLSQATTFVERNPARFPHVDARELSSRKQISADLQQRAMRMKDVYTGRDTQAKLEGDQRRQLHSRAVAEQEAAARRSNAFTAANADFIGQHQQQQQQTRQQQDHALGRISNTLDTLGQMAIDINTEVREQDKIITDVDREIDEAQGKMDHALKGIQKLLQTKDNCQLATICILVVIFIIVAAVAFYVLTG